jgi:hypothetical protein
MGMLRRHWLFVVGAVPAVLQIYHWIDRALEAIEHLELIQRHQSDIKEWWAMISDIPEWANGVILLTGLALIYWDIRRNRRVAAPAVAMPVASAPSGEARPEARSQQNQEKSRLADMTPGERDRLGTMIFQLSDILHTRAEPLVNVANEISQHRSLIPIQETRAKVAKLGEDTDALQAALFHGFTAANRFYDFEIFQIIQNNLAINNLRIACPDYMLMVTHLEGVDETKVRKALELAHKNLTIATKNFQDWIIESLRRISVLRAALR